MGYRVSFTDSYRFGLIRSDSLLIRSDGGDDSIPLERDCFQSPGASLQRGRRRLRGGSGPAVRWLQPPGASTQPRAGRKKGQGPEVLPSKPRPEHNQPEPEPESEDDPVTLPHHSLLSGGLTRALARRPHPYAVGYGIPSLTTPAPWSDHPDSRRPSRLPSPAFPESWQFPP